jgi:hypothetical protein
MKKIVYIKTKTCSENKPCKKEYSVDKWIFRQRCMDAQLSIFLISFVKHPPPNE